jgi:hypothetical protein
MSTTANAAGGEQCWYGWALLAGTWERLTHGHANRTAAAVALDQVLADRGLDLLGSMDRFLTGGHAPPNRLRKKGREGPLR